MRQAIVKSAQSLWRSTPILVGVLLFISLINTFLTKSVYEKIFGHGEIFDSLIGAFTGSISAGAPVNSYILGGEFLKNGVSLIAITAFVVTWVTVGLIQIPIEGKILGRKFAILRNISAFVLAIFVAVIVSFLVRL